MEKKDEAQLIFDLKKELGFNEQYFEKKLNYLFGYTNEIDKTISEKSILDFHLAHKTNPEFSFEPKENTNPLIWKYLAASNLLYQTNEIDLDVNTLRALEEGLENFAGCAVIISHDRWFLDRICTHILAFEGDSQVYFFEGTFSEYEENKRKRLGDAGPQRIKYKKLLKND